MLFQISDRPAKICSVVNSVRVKFGAGLVSYKSPEIVDSEIPSDMRIGCFGLKILKSDLHISDINLQRHLKP